MTEKYRNTVSIIAGQWRGTKLQVSNVKGLRPTSARTRETVFNWLQNDIRSAHCLDLFAGSGALGFEAGSRGAANVVMVDQHLGIIHQLQNSINHLKAERLTAVNQEALVFLQATPLTFDIIFLDPPFEANILNSVYLALEQNGRLAENAKIYIETAKQTILEKTPDNWQQLRSKTAGEVKYYLFQRTT